MISHINKSEIHLYNENKIEHSPLGLHYLKHFIFSYKKYISMNAYQTKSNPLSGTDYREIYRKANVFYKKITQKSKRTPYVRCAYFKKKKVFLQAFWTHLHQKNWRDRGRRLKYLPCALELIERSTFAPSQKLNPNRPSEILYRFEGITTDKKSFAVQIKEDSKKQQKYLMSVFPISKTKKTLR